MRGERKSKTLRSKLFLYYGVLICSILAVFLIYYFSYNTKLIRNKQLTSMQNISDRILAQYDKELESLDAISINIVSSKLFKNYFFYPAEETLKRPQNIDKMNELVFSITGPMASFYRINVIDGNRYQYSFCTQVRPEAKQLSEENVASWLERTIEKDGERYIVPSEKDDGPQTISICKVFPEIYGMKMNNVIEVQQTYQEFAEYVEAAIAKSEMKNPQIYIYNEDGILLYPLAGEEETDGSEIRWEHLNGQNEQAGVIEEMWETTHFNKNYVAYSKSPASKLTVAVVESEQNILSPLYTFLRTAIMGALLILMVTLAVSYYVARHVTSPLDELYHSVTQFTLADADALKKRRKDSSIFEIDALERAFCDMGERLQKSLDQVVSLRTHEVQSRMLALQAQMNPHFLYNTLSLIHVMAEDGCEEEILNVTECLSEMLRYISSGSTEPVIMRREIGFVENYLAIIHERYGDKLKCEINIPQSMQQIKMPKLIIQPLLENCTKYAMNGRPPWLLSVTGELTDDRWRVSVCDNGPGFSAEVLQELSEKMAAADLNNNTEVLEIDGMGLVNIYTRLKLFYGKEGYFEIKNSAGGGAEIIIGGTYEGEIEI